MLRKLYGAKFSENVNLIKHITRILEIIDKVSSIGGYINDSHISVKLPWSLSQSNNTLIIVMEARPEKELNFEFIKGNLTDEYLRRG